MNRRSLVTSAALMLALAAGCSSNNNPTTPTDSGTPDSGTPDSGTPDSGTPDSGTPDSGTPDAGSTDGGMPTTATAATSNAAEDIFALALDAQPSPDGSKIYFIAVDGNGGGVFSTSSTAGSTATRLTTGGILGAPLGLALSTDGTKIYLADPGATTPHDKGAIVIEPAAGGSPTLLAETEDFSPQAVAVSQVGGSDEIVFIGADPTTGVSAVYKDVSGTVTPVISGNSPSGVAVATDGTIYILDDAGTIAKVAPGATTATALPGTSTPLSLSFPSGIDVSLDQTALLVSGFDATGKEAILRVNIASGTVTQLTLSPAPTGTEPAGLHRALNSDTYAFVDSGANTSGTIYLLK